MIINRASLPVKDGKEQRDERRPQSAPYPGDPGNPLSGGNSAATNHDRRGAGLRLVIFKAIARAALTFGVQLPSNDNQGLNDRRCCGRMRGEKTTKRRVVPTEGCWPGPHSLHGAAVETAAQGCFDEWACATARRGRHKAISRPTEDCTARLRRLRGVDPRPRGRLRAAIWVADAASVRSRASLSNQDEPNFRSPQAGHSYEKEVPRTALDEVITRAQGEDEVDYGLYRICRLKFARCSPADPSMRDTTVLTVEDVRASLLASAFGGVKAPKRIEEQTIPPPLPSERIPLRLLRGSEAPVTVLRSSTSDCGQSAIFATPVAEIDGVTPPASRMKEKEFVDAGI
ncbi:hypothetical protein BDK51DRAFT_39320 [Blyttiomyces helicus]|uniref:Uncharacterized protein n=1 Tax=Blyttiomyces helicus TaxID=388810 RepID=A0A4P9WJG9_9FUNG|nr:hypothetical protein BDK51DRAFT_39320 [Blyttiomyces helicus]|eukprot:RKO91648.1 hypothetical protein BDK51DRAFT_39320 [Blyttiomyces helicus]